MPGKANNMTDKCFYPTYYNVTEGRFTGLDSCSWTGIEFIEGQDGPDKGKMVKAYENYNHRYIRSHGVQCEQPDGGPRLGCVFAVRDHRGGVGCGEQLRTKATRRFEGDLGGASREKSGGQIRRRR